MPTYDYECQNTDCAHTFESFQSMSARPLRKCPECGGSVKRLIGAGAGIIFKGSGFYITDYRSNDYKERAKADHSSSSSSSSSESSASDKKESKAGEPKESKAKKSDGKESA